MSSAATSTSSSPASSSPTSPVSSPRAPLTNLSTVADAQLLNPADRSVHSLSSICGSQIVVLLFLRRFGCVLCRQLCKRISPLSSILAPHNVKIVAIVPELLGYEEFAAGGYWPKEAGELYVDDGKKTYSALQFKRFGWLSGIAAIFKKSSRKLAAEAKANGVAGNLKGDGFQLGALFVAAPGLGETWLEFRQTDYAEYPSNEAIVKAIGEHVPGVKQAWEGGQVQSEQQEKQQTEKDKVVCDDNSCAIVDK